MKKNEPIIDLIDELTNVAVYSVENMQEVLGCKYEKITDSENAIDWLVPNEQSATTIYTSDKHKKYPQVTNSLFETISLEENKKEYFISIYLNSDSFLNLKFIIDKLGTNHQLFKQPINLPEDKRCYIEYPLIHHTLTLGFKSCDNLNEVSHFYIRTK